MSNPAEEEPKLIVDEDWKTQVQREKEELEKKKAEESSGSESSGGEAESSSAPDSEPVEVSKESPQADPQLPPASLELLIASLGTQAMAAMGLVPGEDGKPLPANHTFAKHFIDLSGVLETKTAGNLSEQEGRYLQDTLYQLRMAFVEVQKPK